MKDNSEKKHLPLIEINTDCTGKFISRPNRFLAIVEIDTDLKRVEAHVHDPGRLKEILLPGASLLLKRAEKPGRKTDWDLIAGKVGMRWVLIHSGYHRRISEALIHSGIGPFKDVIDVRPEVTFGRSRMDFLLRTEKGERMVVEVKGCSLSVNGVALFPDAPTTRGARHVEELIDLKRSGYRCALLVLVFRSDSRCFSPNDETDPYFKDIFFKAVDAGVEVYPFMLDFDGRTVSYKGEIPLCVEL